MNWFSNKMEMLRQLPNPYFLLFATTKVIGGIGFGVLLANWLPTWTWWIFIIISLIIAIPLFRLLFGRSTVAR